MNISATQQKSYNSIDDLNSGGVGLDPRNDSSGQVLYRKLRDARSAARAEERKQEISDRGDRDLKVNDFWQEVKQLSIKIFSDIGKDVEVAVWFAEASTRLDGYAGFASSIRLVTQLVREYGVDLHPQPEDPSDDTFSSLAGLNGIGREGTLVQPLRLISLVPGENFGTHTLWHSATNDDVSEIQNAMSQVGESQMRSHLSAVMDAIEALRDCDAVLTDLLGSTAPPFSSLMEILDDTARAIRQLSQIGDSMSAEMPSDVADTSSENNEIVTAGVIGSREQALMELSRIADFFRRTEPHSPISQSLDTLVRRARLDFVSLINELMPDENVREALMNTAGIAKLSQGPE